MISIESATLVYSKEEVQLQLQRIFADPIFTVSDILKRFLSFIVDETMQGRSNQIKEYTIGVNVLHKPLSFNPREDAIVRIHAGRLRRALHQYYKGAGALDPIYISIPKGSYLPVFSENLPGRIVEENTIPNEESLTSRVAQNSAEQFIVTGDMHYAEDKLRISVQMLNTQTREVICSQVVEYKLTQANAFDIQDDIAKKLMTAVSDYCNLIRKRVGISSVMAVA